MSKKKPAKKLTAKQLLFANEFLKDFNATAATKRAGYSENCAAEIGYENLRKPHIQAYIKERIDTLLMSSEETLKSLTDIARADLKKYIIVRKEVYTPMVSIPLADYIARRKDELEKIQYVHDIAKGQGLLGKGKTLDRNMMLHEDRVNAIRYDIIESEVKLGYEPNATKIVAGEPQLVETADIDIVALAKDDAAGRIVKSFTHTKFGPSIEMYPADGALRDLGRYHGLFKDKIEHSGQIDTDPLSPESGVLKIQILPPYDPAPPLPSPDQKPA